MTDLTRQNRNQLMSMMAMSDEITRTNNRIHGLLEGLMDNPGNKHNLDNSINDLLTKVNNLKNVDIGTEFQVEETVIVPTRDDASPKKDVRPRVLRPEPASVVEAKEEVEELEAELEEAVEEEYIEEKPEPVKPTKTPPPTRRLPKNKKNRKREVKRPLRGLHKKVEILDPDIPKD